MTTLILLKANGMVILPFTAPGHRSAVDYCCTAASGIFDPTETQSNWKNGDISFAGGWLRYINI